MGRKIMDPFGIKEPLLADLKKFHGDNLTSVILYGSALTPDYIPGASDINILVILKDRSLDLIGRATGYHRKWEKKNVHISFYFTAAFIEASLDTFPVEFLNMKRHYKVLLGEDVLAGLQFKASDLRLQCERELRGKSVHLRREFLINSGNAKRLQASMKMTLKDFLPVFNAMLFLKHEEIPDGRVEAIKKFIGVYGIGTDILRKISQNEFGKGVHECVAMYYDYSSVVDSLILKIDRMGSEKE